MVGPNNCNSGNIELWAETLLVLGYESSHRHLCGKNLLSILPGLMKADIWSCLVAKNRKASVFWTYLGCPQWGHNHSPEIKVLVKVKQFFISFCGKF